MDRWPSLSRRQFLRGVVIISASGTGSLALRRTPPVPHPSVPAPPLTPTLETSVYPDVHTLAGPPGMNYRLAVPGSHESAEGALIAELRGWLRHIDGPNASERPDPVDFHYDLELDPEWTDRLGIDMNQLMRVGSVLEHRLDRSENAPLAAASPAKLHVEVMAWSPGQTISEWPAFLNARRNIPQPSDWLHSETVKDRNGSDVDTRWPWDPRLASTSVLGSSTTSTLHADDADGGGGDYVRMIGALVTDFAHDFDPLPWGDDFQWSYGGRHLNDGNPSRWTEMHPPDSVEVLPKKHPTESVRCIELIVKDGGTQSIDIDIPAPLRRAQSASLVCEEHVNPSTSNLDSIVEGNHGAGFRANTGAKIDLFPNGLPAHAHVHVKVGSNANLTVGKFNATYRVRWKSSVNPGLAAFFTSESIILAQLGGYDSSARNAVDTAVHRQWALAQGDAEIIIRDLEEKLRLQFLRQASMPPAAASPTGFFADCATRWARYGAIFEPRTPPYATNANDIAWSPHNTWAQKLRNDATLGRTGLGDAVILTELDNRCRTLCEGALLRNFPYMLYAWESVFLAELDGKGDSNPGDHFDWAYHVDDDDAVIAQLVANYNLQFDRLAASAPALIPSVYARVSVRLNSLGIDFGSASANSLDESAHANWAASAGLSSVKTETERRIRGAFINLLTV